MGLAFLITTDRLQLLGERKVLKEAEYSALLDATAVVEAAREEAARLVAQGADDAVSARAEGRALGLREAQAEQAAATLGEALAAERQLVALRASMARIIVRAVEQCIDESEPRALFESALRRVDGLIRDQPFVTVRVAGADARAAREALDRLAADAEWVRRVSLVVEADQRRGACVVETAAGTLEIGVDAQLDAFRRAVARDGLSVAAGRA